MKFNCFILILLIFIASGWNVLYPQRLSENLKIMEPLVNKLWEGELKAPDGSASWKTTREFKVIWDGTVIKYTSSMPGRNSYAEGFFYWDREEQKIGVFIVNSGGIYQKGIVTIENDLVTVTGRIYFPERNFEYRNTFEIKGNDNMIDRWYQNAFGSWREGHIITFQQEIE